jgi:DNA polymerase III subunit beta
MSLFDLKTDIKNYKYNQKSDISMKFTVSSNNLLKQLQLVGSAIGSNPVLPILENFLFTLQGDTLTIAATDLETSMTTQLEVSADENESGAVAIPAQILQATLKALGDKPVTINVNTDTFGIEIISSNGKCECVGENGADYPRIPTSEGAEKIEVPANVLTQGISKTIFATSNDELRPQMTGVFFQIEENKLTLVATDAHKLVRYTFTNVQSEHSSTLIVPKKALNALSKALKAGQTVEVGFTKANAFFTFGHVHMSCRLIDARYPDYNAVIPVNNPNILTLERKLFHEALKVVVIYASKTTNQVVLNISDKSLTISTQDLDFSNQATQQLPCIYEGTPLTIGFNAKFLMEMLNVLESDEVKMELSTPTRAGILRPATETEGEDILMLVMPTMLSN